MKKQNLKYQKRGLHVKRKKDACCNSNSSFGK